MNNSVEDAPVEWWRVNLLNLIFDIIVASRAIIGLCVLVCLVLAMQRLSGPPMYKVEALLIQNSEQAGSMRQVSTGLAGLLGGGGGSLPEIDEFQVLLSSPATAAVLDKKYHLLHDMFGWDKKNNRWNPPGWKDRLHYRFVEALGGIKHEDPNYYDLAKYLGTSILFQRSVFGSVMSISMVSDRPDDAKRWLSEIIYEVSDIIRTQMINERQSYVDYLQLQLSQSTLASSRDAIISILADQYRSLMVLKSAKTFPLEQLQPPTRDQFPVNKSVSLLAAYGILAGLMIAGILIACGVRDATLARLVSRFFFFWRKE